MQLIRTSDTQAAKIELEIGDLDSRIPLNDTIISDQIVSDGSVATFVALRMNIALAGV